MTTTRTSARPVWLGQNHPPTRSAPDDPTETELVVTLDGIRPRFTSADEALGIWTAVRADGSYVTVAGPLAHCAGGELVRCRGRWRTHRTHGWTFHVDAFESALPQTREGITAWLQSDRVPGIGTAFAEAIVDAYGTDAFRVIDEDPEVLYDLCTRHGTKIARAPVAALIAAWDGIKVMRQLETWLFSAGVSANLAARLYRAYGEEVVAVLERDPYRITELPRIGFRIADGIARGLGISPDDPRRVRAGLVFVLEQAEGEGHTYLGLEQLFRRAAELPRPGAHESSAALAVGDRQVVARIAGEMVVAGELVVEDDPERQQRIYRRATYETERRLATKIRDLCAPPRAALIAGLVRPPHTAPRGDRPAYVPTDEQWRAVEMCVTHRLSILSGGPGVGKTATQDMLISELHAAGLAVALCAPTGKAARRMMEVTGEPASTIHRLLEWAPAERSFARDARRPIEADVVICDEASMLSIDLALPLLDAIGPTTHLLLVGDPDQLPPVGVGKVLADLITSGAAPRVHLTEIFRQAAGSMIIANAHRINSGKVPYLRHADAEGELGREMRKDMFWIGRTTPAECAELVVEFATSRLAHAYGLDPRTDIMVLAPMHSGPCGLDVLNARIQETLNPDGVAIGVKNIRCGDRVVQTRNDYTRGRESVNGQVGIVTAFDARAQTATIALDDERAILVPIPDMDTWDLAWGITIHKSQGSQWPAIVTAISKAHYVMLSRALTYTAVTRAQQVVVMVGERAALEIAVKRDDAGKRNSTLTQRILDAELSGELV